MFCSSKFKQDLLRISVGSLAAVLALMPMAAAGRPGNETAAEMALAPSYCPDTMSYGKPGSVPDNPSPEAKRWVAVMGKSFWAMHHYCWGEINRQRAMRRGVSPVIRQGLLESALGDYAYVVNYAPDDFVLAPEIRTRMGEVQLLLARPRDAEKSFAKARALKRDYWPAYSHWVEYLMKVGRNAEARKLVGEGLKYAPRSRVLREQNRVLSKRRQAIAAQPGDSDASSESEGASTESAEASASMASPKQ